MPKRSTKTTGTRSSSRSSTAKKTRASSKTQNKSTTASAARSTKRKSTATRKSAVARTEANETTIFSTALQKSQTTPKRPVTDTTTTLTSFSQLMTTWFSFLVVTLVTYYLVNVLFPDYLVFGTDQISGVAALLQSAALLSLLVVGAIPIIEIIAGALNKRISDSNWMIIYLAINTVGIWIISRFAEVAGMGISSWIVALVTGFILTLAQGIAYKMLINPLTSRDA